MVSPVVLNEHLDLRIDQVAAREECSCRIDDVRVAQRVWQPGEHQHQSKIRLHGRFGPDAQMRDGTSRSAHARKVSVEAILRDGAVTGCADVYQPVTQLNQLDEREAGGAIDECPIWPGHRQPTPLVCREAALTAMQPDSVVLRDQG